MKYRILIIAILFVWCGVSAFAQTDPSPKISFSFDDGSTNDFPGYDSEVWNEMLLNKLEKHGVKAILFVTGSKLANAKGANIIHQWDSLGHLIGNHTYSHASFNSKKVSLDYFKADFLKNDSLIRAYNNYTQLFRFPYLKEGNTIEKRDGFRNFLNEQGYKNGNVTIDASDWYVNARLVNQLKKDAKSDLTAYKTFYLDHIMERALFYDSLAFAMTGRRIHHNLLLHHNLIAALFLDDLIELFKNQGWEIIDVDKAYKDPIYEQSPQNIPAGESLIWALAKESKAYEGVLRFPAEDSRYEKEKLDSVIDFTANKITYESENLNIEQLSKNTFKHVSFLNTKTYGSVPCNGMIVVDNQEAIIIDTPVDDTAAIELIHWVNTVLNCQIKGVVVTHFHVDCLGGLGPFHTENITSYACNKTIALAKQEHKVTPQTGFDTILELKVGNNTLNLDYLGEGHTKDNIVCYYPNDRVLFGGCLIKGVGSGKGNLADASVDSWSATVYKVKEKYKNAKIIIPGHGKCGGQELLTYTIRLFENK